MPDNFDSYDDDVVDDSEVQCSRCGCEYYAEEHGCCPECDHRERDGDISQYSTDVLTASGYSFAGAAEIPTPRLRMGFELESTCSTSRPSHVAKKPLNDAFATLRSEFPFARCYCITKSDASIRGPNPAEIVTIPLSVPEHARVLFKAFPDGRVGGRALQCWSNDSCGFHIHAPVYAPARMGSDPKRCISQLDVGRLLVFINEPRNQRFWIELCGRGPNTYAQFRRTHLTEYARLQQRRSPTPNFGKYDALNVTPGRTLELRLPRPTARIKSLLKNLELFESSIQWVRLRSLAAPFMWHEYLTWLAEPHNRKTYTYLHDWLSRRSSKYSAFYKALL